MRQSARDTRTGRSPDRPVQQVRSMRLRPKHRQALLVVLVIAGGCGRDAVQVALEQQVRAETAAVIARSTHTLVVCEDRYVLIECSFAQSESDPTERATRVPTTASPDTRLGDPLTHAQLLAALDTSRYDNHAFCVIAYGHGQESRTEAAVAALRARGCVARPKVLSNTDANQLRD
jgi:hypothetical protein